MAATLTSVSVIPAFAAEDVTEPVEVYAEEGEKKTEEVGDVDITREPGDKRDTAVYVKSCGGEAELKTGDITGSGSEKVVGIKAYSNDEGKADVKTGDINTNDSGVISYSSTGGDTFVAVNGSINSVDRGVAACAKDENSLAAASVEGDVNVNAEYNDASAVFSSSENKGEADIVVGGDVNSAGDGINSQADSGGKSSLLVIGNVTSSGTAKLPGKYDDEILMAASSGAFGEGSVAEAFVAGDVTMKGNEGAAILLRSVDGGKASMTVGGTVRGGEIPVEVYTTDKDFSNISLTVWKIEPNTDGAVAGVWNKETKTLKRSEELEKTINYIIKLEDTSDAELSAQDTAHEGDKVILKVDVDDGYELVGAYNGMDEKVPLVKDANGEWYVIVPKGGGIYLSVELKKKEDSKKSDDKKDDNNITAAPLSTGAYATAEAFSSAAVSMISSAAPGSTVTIDATSFTSLPASIVASLLARPDVTFVFTYMLNGIMYKVTIPAGTNLAGLLNASGGIDFASLATYTSVTA